MYKNIEGMTREDRRAAVRTIEARRAALVECYKQTREGEPADTIAELIARIGYADALAAVAELVNNVDEWDARIWEYVREWAQGIENAATSAELETFGIYQPSTIHPAHINQLGQAMRNTPAPSTTTTTTIYFKPEDIGRGLNWDDIHAADALGVGMLEQVLPDLIAFHSLQASEVPAVLEWLAEYFGLEWVDVSECETCGNFEKEISEERVYIGKGDPTKCGSCPACVHCVGGVCRCSDALACGVEVGEGDGCRHFQSAGAAIDAAADAAPIEEAEKEITEEAAEEVAQMANNYRIENTTAPNGRASVEVYFNSIPAKATREALKAAGFRWHSVKKCWYGYTDSENARAIIDGSADNWGDLAGATTAPNGYKWQSNGKSRFGGEYKNRLVKADEPQPEPQNRIKIYYNGLRLNGSRELIKCGYSKDKKSGTIWIYCHSYGADLPRDLFDVKNETDLYTDYFDNDSAQVEPSHPLYKYLEFAAYKAESHDLKHAADVNEKRAASPKWARSAEYYKKAAKEYRDRLAQLAPVADPGQPTAEDLAKIDSQRQEAENRRRAEEHAAQLAERERVLAELAEGRRYIEAIAEQYPIEEGAPVVEIPFSESPAFYSWIESRDKTRTEVTIYPDGSREESTIIEEPRRRCLLSVTAAEIVIKHFDTRRHYANVSEGRGGYDKTDFVITWTDESGEPWSYKGRYDLGDNDGGIIAHIENLAKWDATHDKYGHETTEPQPVSAERFAWVELLKKYNRPEPLAAGGKAEGATPSAAVYRVLVDGIEPERIEIVKEAARW